MVDRTDRHFRTLARTIAPGVRLYTEMAVAWSARSKLGRWHAPPRTAVQLAGGEAAVMLQAARYAEDLGYEEINLNCGCPSAAAKAGGYGAWLMRRPDAVAELVAAIGAGVAVPISVKCRLSTHPTQPLAVQIAELDRFVATVASAGCRHFIVHARAAHLGGIAGRARSCRDNRRVPPLCHEAVAGLARRHRALAIALNGGIDSVAAARWHLARAPLASVMIGRAAYDRPLMLAPLAAGRPDMASLAAVVDVMASYIDAQRREGVRAWAVVRHMLGLGRGQPGAKQLRTAWGGLGKSAGADGTAVWACFNRWRAAHESGTSCPPAA